MNRDFLLLLIAKPMAVYHDRSHDFTRFSTRCISTSDPCPNRHFTFTLPPSWPAISKKAMAPYCLSLCIPQTGVEYHGPR